MLLGFNKSRHILFPASAEDLQDLSTMKEGKRGKDDNSQQKMYKKIPTTSTKLNHWFYEIKIGGRAGAEAKLPCHQKTSSECGSKEMILGGNLPDSLKKRVL